MKHLNVRCPSCAKLYQVDVSAIFSTNPHFQCVSCSTRFCFDFPPANPEHVISRLVEQGGPASVIATRKCPRCGSEGPRTADECYSCHVIFEKLEGLPLDSALKAQPSLVRRWKELLEDYTNEDKHQDFVMACRDLDALSFARYKYEHIRQMQGQDDIADRMLTRIEALADDRVAAPSAGKVSAEAPSPAGKFKANLSSGKPIFVTEEAEEAPPAPSAWWRKALLLAPFVISFLMIVWGLAHVGHRNMVGAGIAIALLSYGLITGLKGPLKLKDFLN